MTKNTSNSNDFTMTKPKANNKVNVDLIGFVSNALINTTRFILDCTRTNDYAPEKRIMLCWKRNKVYIETLERGDYATKEYPKLVSKKLQGHNMVYAYRIPTGLSYDKLKNSLNEIEFDLKSEILFKLLENDRKAHFQLKVLSGRLKDLIHFTNEDTVNPENKTLKSRSARPTTSGVDSPKRQSD